MTNRSANVQAATQQIDGIARMGSPREDQDFGVIHACILGDRRV